MELRELRLKLANLNDSGEFWLVWLLLEALMSNQYQS